jgi:hypothetical protein
MSLTKKLVLLTVLVVVAVSIYGAVGNTQDKPTVVVSGTIGSDTTWTADTNWVLQGAVFVDNGATLNIEAGTRIYGQSSTNGTLIVARGSKINAQGRQDAPIVMTSDQPPGQRARADWGGLIINGAAPINVPGGEAFGEGDTGAYGGDNPQDNSGVLRFVRVEYAGTEFSPDNELNGIAFQGVGNGTTAEFLQVHYNKDDGVECFGGTVNYKYVVCTGIADDNFDWTDGWTGNAQFLIAQQYGDDADQGIEADNNAENNDLTPRSNPKLYNLTLIGDPDFELGDESDLGILLREGTAAQIYNAIVMGFKEAGLEIDHGSTYNQAQAGTLIVNNSVFWQNNPNFSTTLDEGAPFTPEHFATQMMCCNTVIDPMLRQPFDTISPDFRPVPNAPVANGELAVAIPPNNGFFDVALFVGAMGAAKDFDFDAPYLGNWVQGWTNFSPN